MPEDKTRLDARRNVLAVLAAAPPDVLAQAWQDLADKPQFELLRGPETGLVMLRGRAGGGGAPFNLGEATVTRATVRLSTGEVGHAYALGRDADKVRIAAVLDALWQRPEGRPPVDALVATLGGATADDDRRRREETAATRADFFTMVRGDD